MAAKSDRRRFARLAVAVPAHLQWYAMAGLVLFFTGLVVTGLQGAFSILSGALCVAGIAVGSVVFMSRVTRNIALFASLALYCAFAVGTIAILFVIVARHPVSFDATKQKLYSLSDNTRSFLGRLDRPVRITAFLTEADRESGTQLLREYERHSSMITYRVLHPFRDIVETRRYGATVMPGDVFVEALTTGTAAVNRSVVVNKLGEEEVTNAIVQLLRGREPVVYFLAGHGELPLDSDKASAALAGRRSRVDDLTWIMAQLERGGIKALTLPLAQRGRVPTDASALVCAGPRNDISGAEREALSNYLQGGGKALFLLNTEVPQVTVPLQNIRGLLEEYGLEFPDSVIVNPDPNVGTEDRFSITVEPLPHRVTQLDSKQPFVMANVRPVTAARAPRSDAVIETLLQSPKNSWALPAEELSKSVVGRRSLDLTFDPSEIKPWPVAQAVTVFRPGAGEEQATRLVVVGNGKFVSSEVITQNAWLFFSNALNWLTSTSDLIAIPTSNIENTPVTLTSGQKQFLFLLLVIIIPTLVGLSGLGYAIVRRELS